MNSQTNKASKVTAGTLLIADATLLPDSANSDRISVGHGWGRIGDKAAFEKNLDAAGWTSFYLAGTIRKNVIGFDAPRSLETAVKRLLGTVVLAQGNCLEVDRITTQSFCGIPSVTVTGHSRHIQRQSAFLKTQDSPK